MSVIAVRNDQEVCLCLRNWFDANCPTDAINNSAGTIICQRSPCRTTSLLWLFCQITKTCNCYRFILSCGCWWIALYAVQQQLSQQTFHYWHHHHHCGCWLHPKHLRSAQLQATGKLTYCGLFVGAVYELYELSLHDRAFAVAGQLHRKDCWQ